MVSFVTYYTGFTNTFCIFKVPNGFSLDSTGKCNFIPTINVQQQHVQIPYSEFNLNQTINVEDAGRNYLVLTEPILATRKSLNEHS